MQEEDPLTQHHPVEENDEGAEHEVQHPASEEALNHEQHHIGPSSIVDRPWPYRHCAMDHGRWTMDGFIRGEETTRDAARWTGAAAESPSPCAASAPTLWPSAPPPAA